MVQNGKVKYFALVTSSLILLSQTMAVLLFALYKSRTIMTCYDDWLALLLTGCLQRLTLNSMTMLVQHIFFCSIELEVDWLSVCTRVTSDVVGLTMLFFGRIHIPNGFIFFFKLWKWWNFLNNSQLWLVLKTSN